VSSIVYGPRSRPCASGEWHHSQHVVGTTAEPTPQLGPYVASKFGVLGLTRVAAGEYAADNIRVNAVLPGTTLTPLVEEYFSLDPTLEERSKAAMPFGKFGEPAELRKPSCGCAHLEVRLSTRCRCWSMEECTPSRCDPAPHLMG